MSTAASDYSELSVVQDFYLVLGAAKPLTAARTIVLESHELTLAKRSGEATENPGFSRLSEVFLAY